VVSVFFILSGFFRSLSYWKKLDKDEAIPELFPSLKDRFLRIAPSYYLALVVTLIYVMLMSGLTWEVVVRFFSGVLFLNWVSATTFFPVDHN
jgi:peptidoglycan/LPS O-acetylase OafA/YrhL